MGSRQKRRREEEGEQTGGFGRPSARSSASAGGGWGNSGWADTPSSATQSGWGNSSWADTSSSVAQSDWGKSAWGEPSAATQDGWDSTAGGGWDSKWNASGSSKTASVAAWGGQAGIKGKEKAEATGDSPLGNESKNAVSSAAGTQTNFVWGEPPGASVQSGGWADATLGGWAASNSPPQAGGPKTSAWDNDFTPDSVPDNSPNPQAQGWPSVAPLSHVQQDASVMNIGNSHDAVDAMDQDSPKPEVPRPVAATVEERPSRRRISPVQEGRNTLREDNRGNTHEDFIRYLSQ
jgi:hypothetical protein